MEERPIVRAFEGIETMDGAGVKLRRIFGHREVTLLDPFLLLDLFGAEEPDLYLPGFPWHPHRGIETVTYMLAGTVRHGDSMGNAGFIGPGDVQWMTAGSGIVHEEMPQASPLGLRGFQLWVNLPAAEKMRDPAYRGFSSADIPAEVVGGGEVRAIAGRFERTTGPVQGLERAPALFDVRLANEGSVSIDAPRGHTAFACVYAGSLASPVPPGGQSSGEIPAEDGGPRCFLLGDGDIARFKAASGGCSFLFGCGEPIREDIAWGGPIVMNTREELELAFREYEAGTFVKKRAI